MVSPFGKRIAPSLLLFHGPHKTNGFPATVRLFSDSRLRQTADVNLYHVTKFFPYFPFTLYFSYTKISSFIHKNCFGKFFSAYFLF